MKPLGYLVDTVVFNGNPSKRLPSKFHWFQTKISASKVKKTLKKLQKKILCDAFEIDFFETFENPCNSFALFNDLGHEKNIVFITIPICFQLMNKYIANNVVQCFCEICRKYL